MRICLSILLSASTVGLIGCGPSEPASVVEIEEIAVANLPAEVASLVVSARSGFQPVEVQKKTRDGRVYYDVEGELADGSELEFDVLMTPKGPKIVETQRDLSFSEVPAIVQTLALEVAGGVKPVRIIESIQEDDVIIFEFFQDGKPQDPAYEVKWDNGQAEVLTDRWAH